MDETETPGLLWGPSLGMFLPFPHKKTEHGDVMSPHLEVPMVLMLLCWEIPPESPETTPKAVAGVLGVRGRGSHPSLSLLCTHGPAAVMNHFCVCR